MVSPPPQQTTVHFYRAVVAHMDVWRQRMDATTNWAAATAAGMITFAFSTPTSPQAPSEQMLDWNAVPPPLSRLWRGARRRGGAPMDPERNR